MKRLLSLCLALTACAPAAWRWDPAGSIKRPAATDYPGADAVVIARKTSWTLSNDADTAAVRRRFERVMILSDAGLKRADAHVVIPDGTVLRLVQARTIASDGQAYEVAPADIHGDTFRYPHAEVGAIFEVAYTTTSAKLPRAIVEPISDDIPVMSAHTELVISPGIHFGFRLFNSDAAIKQTEVFDNNRIAFKLVGLPPIVRGEGAPPPSLVEPWWAWHPTQRRGGPARAGSTLDWAFMYADQARKLYQDEQHIDIHPDGLDVADCKGEQRCVVGRALGWVTKTTHLSGFVDKFSAARPMAAVASGQANNFEKALLLSWALRWVGVEAYPALTGRDRNLRMIDDFALPDSFDHLVVLVPQDRPDKSLFVDPSCETCAVGELPGWSGDRRALSLCWRPTTGKGSLSTIQTSTKPGRVSSRSVTFDAQVDGAALRGQRISAVSGDTQLEQAGCDARQPNCESREPWTGAVTVAGDDMTIAFDMLSAPPPERPIQFAPREEELIDTLKLAMPKGWAYAAPVAAMTETGRALEASLSIEATSSAIVVKQRLRRHGGVWRADDAFDANRALAALAEARRAGLHLRRIK